MGIIIDKCKTDHVYGKQPGAGDGYVTDETGRLVPERGEVFEVMPLGSLVLLAYLNMANSYRQIPYIAQGMRWETGFSQTRLYFFSPDTNQLLGGIADRGGTATLGFYYYEDLCSLSLGSAFAIGGPYVSMVFSVQGNIKSQMLLGIRVHATPQHLHAFATMLAARVVESSRQSGTINGSTESILGSFFEAVNSYDYHTGAQTDLFLDNLQNESQFKIDAL